MSLVISSILGNVHVGETMLNLIWWFPSHASLLTETIPLPDHRNMSKYFLKILA